MSEASCAVFEATILVKSSFRKGITSLCSDLRVANVQIWPSGWGTLTVRGAPKSGAQIKGFLEPFSHRTLGALGVS